MVPWQARGTHKTQFTKPNVQFILSLSKALSCLKLTLGDILHLGVDKVARQRSPQRARLDGGKVHVPKIGQLRHRLDGLGPVQEGEILLSRIQAENVKQEQQSRTCTFSSE